MLYIMSFHTDLLSFNWTRSKTQTLLTTDLLSLNCFTIGINVIICGLTLLYMGGGIMAPPEQNQLMCSCVSGFAFGGTPIGWQFLFTLIFESSFCLRAKNDLEKVLEYPFWGKGQNSKFQISKNKFVIPKSCNIIVLDIFICNFFYLGLFMWFMGI